ncbi:MAG: hypothetical protein ACREQA_20645 [Candidatus Binatia bacterium]
MTNIFMFFLFSYLSAIVLSFTLEGVTGLATATLTANIDADDTTFAVDSTDNWLTSDHFNVDAEIVCYSGKTATSFTGLTRGCKNTTPGAHTAGTRIYNEGTNVANQAIGFNIVQTISDDGVFFGTIKVITHLPQMLARIVIKLIMWDFSFLTGAAVYIKYLILYPLSGGLIISLVQLIFRR